MTGWSRACTGWSPGSPGSAGTWSSTTSSSTRAGSGTRRAVFAPYPLLSVGVRCPLDEVIRREAARRNRTLGQARAHFESVHAHVGYDVEVDTSAANPEACAEVIAAAVAGHRGPSRLAALL